MSKEPTTNDLLIRTTKNLLAADNAILLLMVEKGLLKPEDLRRFAEIKLGQVAQLDQAEAASLDAIAKKRKEG